MRIDFDLAGAAGSFAYHFEGQVEFQGVLGVLGPSGAGKSTLLRALAGLDRGVEGELVIDGDALQLRGASPRPTHLRGIAMVFQDGGLLPHLDVRRNLGFAARRRQGRAGPPLPEIIDSLALNSLLARSVATLSGGERQRVAIGRALAAAPRLLLLDEPVSALHAEAREEVLSALESLPRRFEIPIVHVSHAIGDLVRTAAWLMWIEDGQVRRHAAVEDLVGDPELARSLGEEAGSMLPAEVCEHDDRDHLTRVQSPLGPLWLRRLAQPVGAQVRVRIFARDVSLARPGQDRGSILNGVTLPVRSVRPGSAGESLVQLGPEGGPLLLAKLTNRSVRQLELREGSELEARIKAVSLVA